MNNARIGRIALPALLLFTLLLGACAVGPAPRSYPDRPFHDARLSHVQVGISADSLISLFGQPDSIYDMTFGAQTDREWEGVAYRYYAARDLMYQHVDEWKKNTFYFYRSPRGLVLNHWVIEHQVLGATK